jgi:hypothetical protein
MTAKQNFVGEPTQSCIDSLDVAGFLAENRQPLFGNLLRQRSRPPTGGARLTAGGAKVEETGDHVQRASQPR